MAYDDALFQLGMDLTRSSTAQKEDHGKTAPVAHEDRKDFFIERDGVRFAGNHLLIDLFGARRLDDIKHIETTLKRCVEVAGATLLHIHLREHKDKTGISGAAVLAEGHMSVHSWPEMGYLVLDAFMGRDAKPELAIDVAKQAFMPVRAVVRQHMRAGGTAERAPKAVRKRAPAREKARVAA